MDSGTLLTLSARLWQVPAPTAWNLGWLMNCRGLSELIVLNIGLRLGILSPTIFGLFVAMALVTTGLTGPLLRLQATPGPGPREGMRGVGAADQPPRM
ncbi:MAG: hypothetical protein VKL58_06320 [Cyanobacteriota bacterium]|nr:hypothetical protein [Cyanobacteriota bacterium]